jgi:hypothetical protein
MNRPETQEPYRGEGTWRLNVNGTWQPAGGQTQIEDWIRRGFVGPDTLIQHSTWSNPIPLARVPHFAGMFAPRNVQVQKPPVRQLLLPGVEFNAKNVLTVGWALGAVVAFFVIVGSAVPVAVSALLLGVSSIAIGMIGRMAARSPAAVKAVSGVLWRRRTPWAVWSAVLLIGGGTAIARRMTDAVECNRYVAETASIRDVVRTSSNYDETMKRLEVLAEDAEKGRAFCAALGMTSAATGLTAVPEEIWKQRSVAWDQAKRENEKTLAAQKKEAAAKEAEAATVREHNAVTSFPARSTDIKGKLGETETLANQGKWIESEQASAEATEMLGEFRETSVEKTDGWATLSTRLDAVLARIAPKVARIHQKEAAQEEQAQGSAALRGKKPAEWVDGCCFECREYLKRAMNDPDSYECVSATQPQIEGPYWTVLMSFRGTNGFGAKVVNTQKFFIQGGQVVKTED